MALNNTYFESNKLYEPLPIPEQPGYVPPVPPTPPDPDPGSTPVIPSPSFSGDTTITLYVNNSERNVVTKNLSNPTNINISIKDRVSTKTPHIVLNGDYDGYNYMYFNGKYYFIFPTLSKGGITEIDAEKVDGLMTYDAVIRSHTAVIERNAYTYNKYLNDSSFRTYAYKQTKTLEFPSGFNKALQWVLVAIGGTSNA